MIASAKCAELMFEVLHGLRRDITNSPFPLEVGYELSGHTHRPSIVETVAAASSLGRSRSPNYQAAASPAVVSVSVSSTTISQPWLAAYAQAILKSGIFQSLTSEVSAKSSRVSVLPCRASGRLAHYRPAASRRGRVVGAQGVNQ
jgi:hypothetical protein